MSNLAKSTMQIINAIQQYIDNDGDPLMIVHYYELYHTYVGIDNYLKKYENEIGVQPTKEMQDNVSEETHEATKY